MTTRHPWLAIIATAMFLAPDTPFANGLNLSWNDCGSAGTANRQFACDINYGQESLVLSARFPSQGLYCTGVPFIAELDLVSERTTLPAWWQTGTATSCRAGAIGATTYGVQSCGSMSAVKPTLTSSMVGTNPDRVRWVVTCPPGGGGIELPGEDYEFYLCTITISHAKTVAGGACGGCYLKACVVFNSLLVYRDLPPHPFHAYVNNPLERNFVTWQGGASGLAICPAATPTRNQTWGSLKSLYR